MIVERDFSLVVVDPDICGSLDDKQRVEKALERLLTQGVHVVTSGSLARPYLGEAILPHLRQRLLDCPGQRLFGHSRLGERAFLRDIESLGSSLRHITWEKGIDPVDVLILGKDVAPAFEEGARFVPKNGTEVAEILERMAERVEKGQTQPLPEHPHRDPTWVVVETGYNVARELEAESLLTIANGFAGTRGTLFERDSPLGPGTLVAGVFDTIPGDNPVPGLVAAPEWARLRMSVLSTSEEMEDAGNDLTSGTLLDNRRTLDMGRAMMWREFLHEDEDGRLTAGTGFRFASQADRHLFVQSLKLVPQNYSARIRIEAESDLYPSKNRSYLNPYPSNVTVLRGRGNGGSGPAVVNYIYPAGAEVGVASFARLIMPDGTLLEPSLSWIENRVAEYWEFDVHVGKAYRIDRLVCIFTTREGPKPAHRARDHVRQAGRRPVEGHLHSHLEEWKRRWSISNIEIEGDPDSERALRFACYSLLSAANPQDERVSIGARALTGSSYLGHVFWDTEIFMLPFFIFTAPDIARSLLMYRYHTLTGARENAASKGYAGAMYPWESASTGHETAPSSLLTPSGERIRVITGEQEHHITGDVAFMVWQYCAITGDDNFLYGPGAEILVETARFWASRVEKDADGVGHIAHAIGPDEYHEDITDNAYTNELARWNLRQAAILTAEMRSRLPEKSAELARRLKLRPEEPTEWTQVAETLAYARERNGVIEQFRGYFDLEDRVTTQDNQPGGTDFRIFLDLEHLGKTQLIKQADTLMLLQLFWDRFSPEAQLRNFEYYDLRTLHGSSLSPATHGLIAARLGMLEHAYRYFRMAAEVDLRNNMGNASGGVHSAAQGGLWQATVFGFAGMRAGADGLYFDPHLPPAWKSLRFQVVWRGQTLAVSAFPDGVEVVHRGWFDVPIRLHGGSSVLLSPGETRRWRLQQDTWREEVA